MNSFKSRTRYCAFLTFGVLLLLSGCGNPSGTTAHKEVSTNTQDASAEADWSKSVQSSGIDGDIVRRTKDFTFDTALIRVILTCKLMAKQFEIHIESYEDGGKGASPLIRTELMLGAQTHLVPVGRIRTANGGVENLSKYFTANIYSNEMSWNATETVRRIRIQELRDRYQVNFQKRLHAFERHSPYWIEDPSQRTGATDGNTFLAYGREHGDEEAAHRKTELDDPVEATKSYGGGDYLMGLLPITIEANNEHGAFEVQIPKNDAGVQEIVEGCAH
jgi:uncharacterized protein YceK